MPQPTHIQLHLKKRTDNNQHPLHACAAITLLLCARRAGPNKKQTARHASMYCGVAADPKISAAPHNDSATLNASAATPAQNPKHKKPTLAIGCTQVAHLWGGRGGCRLSGLSALRRSSRQVHHALCDISIRPSERTITPAAPPPPCTPAPLASSRGACLPACAALAV